MYRALYHVVSRGAAAAPAPGGCSLPPDAEGLLAPGSRRLRPSQSLYCMLSPPEPSPAPHPPAGPPTSPPTPPLQPGPPNRGADSSPKGSPSPLVRKDSSFEDLEQFLATSERGGQGPGRGTDPQASGVKEEPLLEPLKSIVKDIHNAVGEGSAGQAGSGSCWDGSQASSDLQGPPLHHPLSHTSCQQAGPLPPPEQLGWLWSGFPQSLLCPPGLPGDHGLAPCSLWLGRSSGPRRQWPCCLLGWTLVLVLPDQGCQAQPEADGGPSPECVGSPWWAQVASDFPVPRRELSGFLRTRTEA